jgi:hypothetical protein
MRRKVANRLTGVPNSAKRELVKDKLALFMSELSEPTRS